MARSRTKKTAKPQERYELLSIVVESFSVRVETGLNVTLKMSPGWTHPEDSVFMQVTTLHISGVCSYPEERVGQRYELAVRGDPRGVYNRLLIKDIEARDDAGTPRYRRYRGGEYPVYEPPLGIAILEPSGTAATWRIYVTIEPRIASDMLMALGSGVGKYISIQEHKIGRKRWVEHLALESVDPAEE